MLESVRRKRRMRQGQIDGGYHLSGLKRIKEDLSTFSKEYPLTFSAGVAQKPYDMAYSIAAELIDGTPIDIIYDENKIRYAVRSTLGAPTATAPAMLMTNVLKIYPTTITQGVLRYYHTPAGMKLQNGNYLRTDSLPTYAYTVVNGVEMYDTLNSVDFELPEFYFPYLLTELALMAGVNLRDRDVMAFSQMSSKDNNLMTTE
jgi:hypothetical protein